MSEAELRANLLQALLKNITHCASLMTYLPLGKGSEEPQVPHDAKAKSIEYASSFSVKVNMEARQNRRGRKPHVDYVISGFSNDTLLYVIPVEAKKVMTIEHMSQLAHYVSTMCSTSCAGVGLLIDSTKVCIAFSMLSQTI